MKNCSTSSLVLVILNKDKKSDKNCRSSLERLTTKKVIAIEVSEVSGSLVITRLRLNLRFACPNFPSIALRKRSSERACFFSSSLRFFGGLPNFGPVILIPLSLHQFLFSLVQVFRPFPSQ